MVEGQKISYKHFTQNDLLFPENKQTLIEISNIFIENLNLKKEALLESVKELLGFTFEKVHFFVIFDKGKVIGFNSGIIDKNTFFTMQTHVLKSYQNKNIGTKLKIRTVAILRARYGVSNFDHVIIINDKMFSINEKIANRLQRTKKGKYVAEKDPNLKGYFNYKKELKPKNILKFKKRK
jgi:hypothetical protein